MAGHRKERGGPIVFVARHEQRRERLARQLAVAETARQRAEAAFDYLRAGLSAVDRRHPRIADDIADRAAAALQMLGDELYTSVAKERRARR